MDAVKEAELCINRAHDNYAEHPTVSALELQFALAYATIAQAQAIEAQTEQLARIADALYTERDNKVLIEISGKIGQIANSR